MIMRSRHEEHDDHEGDATTKTTKSSPFVIFVLVVPFVRQKLTVRLNRANRGFSTVVGRSQLAPLEATS